MRRGVVIRTVINGFTFDAATKDPMQQAVRDALIAFMAAMSQAQAEATKAAQRAGRRMTALTSGASRATLAIISTKCAICWRKPLWASLRLPKKPASLARRCIASRMILRALRQRWWRGACEGLPDHEPSSRRQLLSFSRLFECPQ